MASPGVAPLLAADRGRFLGVPCGQPVSRRKSAARRGMGRRGAEDSVDGALAGPVAGAFGLPWAAVAPKASFWSGSVLPLAFVGPDASGAACVFANPSVATHANALLFSSTAGAADRLMPTQRAGPGQRLPPGLRKSTLIIPKDLWGACK